MKKIIKKILKVFGYKLVSLKQLQQPQNLFPLKIRHFFDIYFAKIDVDNFFFLQIGAHNGQHHDHLYPYVVEYKLKGLALEPQKNVFQELKKTYLQLSNVTIANLAVSRETGRQKFFTIEGNESLGTFNRELLLPYKSPIKEFYVDAINFRDLVEKFKITKIDFLQIDCEGYDFEIIKMIDFEKFSPQIINYESVLLSDMDRSACEQLLTSLGYKIFRYERDTCAYKI